jgi:hypothetical protein
MKVQEILARLCRRLGTAFESKKKNEWRFAVVTARSGA